MKKTGEIEMKIEVGLQIKKLLPCGSTSKKKQRF
jgi:hypothetical protein